VLHAAVFRLQDTPVLQDLVAQFQAGVEVFFVVSGFVVARPFVRAVLDGAPLPNVRRYAWRRVVRLFPAYWVAFAVTAFVLDSTDFRSVGDWIVHLLLLQVYWGDQFSRGISVAWTLSVEISFYVLIPIMFVAVDRIARRVSPWTALVGLLGTLYASGWLWTAWTVSGDHYVQAFWLPFFLPVFTTGTLLCVASEYVARHPHAGAIADRVGRLAPWWWAGAVGALALAGALVGQRALFRVQDLFATQVLYALAATLFALPLALGFRSQGALGRLLTWAPLVYVGTVSYGLYIWHNQVVDFIAQDVFGWTEPTQGSAIVITVLTFAVALGIASLSWYLVERPLLRWSRRVL
jgi:peptidoglycan/LPS O-acetylase OafA/YrhL